jgi:hypothetical protein
VDTVKPGGFVYLAPVDPNALRAMQPELDRLATEGYRILQDDYGHGDSILRIVKPATQAPGVDLEAVTDGRVPGDKPGAGAVPNEGITESGSGGADGVTDTGSGPPTADAGNVEKLYLVSRRVEGRSLSELTAGEIFLFKEELAQHRALSILLGDYDRKLDNYFVSKDGRLIAIDAAWADVRGEIARREGLPPDDPFYMEGANGRDHWLSRFFKDEAFLGPGAPVTELWTPERVFSRKGLVAEEALTYQDAKPAIDRILVLVANEPKLRGILEGSFKKIYGNNAAKVKECVDQCVIVLQQRAKRLDEVMRGLDERQLTRPPGAGSMLWPPRRLQELAGRRSVDDEALAEAA